MAFMPLEFRRFSSGAPDVRHRDHEPSEAGEGLTPEHLEALLVCLSPDPQQAGALYEDIRHRLIDQFERWQLGVDSESLADRSIDRVARRLAQGAVVHRERLYSYCRGVAYRVALETYREAKRGGQARHAFAARSLPEPDSEVDPHLPCLETCLGRPSTDEHRLILRYVVEENRISGRQVLAQELGIGLNALRIRAYRVRRKLGGCCSDCLEATTGRLHCSV